MSSKNFYYFIKDYDLIIKLIKNNDFNST